jgi:hypothetical protein
MPPRGGAQPLHPIYQLVGLAVLAGLGLAIAGLNPRFRKKTDDSQDFKQALADWGPVIYKACLTPREFKMSLNRMRLDAMLVREFADPAKDQAAGGSQGQSGFEAHVVTLAALDKVAPEVLRKGKAEGVDWQAIAGDDKLAERLKARTVAALAALNDEDRFAAFRLFKNWLRS